MLALKSVLPLLPMIAALSANHLAAVDLFPLPSSAGSMSSATTTRPVSTRRSGSTNAEKPPGSKCASVPVHGDFNANLCRLGALALLAHLVPQLAPDDVARFARAEDLHGLA